MRVLVIDNYDSFTYNLVQYLGELGAEVLVRRNDEVTPEEVSMLHPDRIVVSPGPCTPNEAGICLDLVGKAGAEIPIFGVCLGHGGGHTTWTCRTCDQTVYGPPRHELHQRRSFPELRHMLCSAA
mgnify:CR=1 FL=1